MENNDEMEYGRLKQPKNLFSVLSSTSCGVVFKVTIRNSGSEISVLKKLDFFSRLKCETEKYRNSEN